MSAFDDDYQLPSLPVPALRETCANIQKLLKPLSDEQIWLKECRVISEFFSENGNGVRLQQLLYEWKSEKTGNESWLRPIWDDRYLSFREMLPVNMSYCFQFEEKWWGDCGLARVIVALQGWIDRIQRGGFSAEPGKNGHLSMDMLRHVVCNRIPNLVRDVWDHPPVTPATVAVACKGHWFILSLQNGDGSGVSPAAVGKALCDIRASAEKMPPADSVAAMTAAPREAAFQIRRRLQQSLRNRLSLDSIEKALFAVCLDDPEDSGRFGCNLLGGDAANRWFDKSLQIISTDSAHIGVNMEHSGCDAGIWVYLFEQIDRELAAQPFSPEQSVPAAHTRLLEWDVEEALARDLQEIRASLQGVVERLSLEQRRLPSVSKDQAKAKGFHPDAVAQMLYQTAYYKRTGRFRSIYESVSTRGFCQGRTECARPLTTESAAFVRAFAEGSAPPETLREQFRIAERVHADNLKQRQKGLGPERHLAGLDAMYQMYRGTAKGAGLEKPEIFSLTGYQMLCRDILSTSSIAAPCIDYFGFGPVVEDGLGIGYGLKPDALHLMVTAYPESGITAQEFVAGVEEDAEKWRVLFEE